MTENEAKQCIEQLKLYNLNGELTTPVNNDVSMLWDGAFGIILDLFEEIQTYRAIGTVEELQSMKENGAFTGIELAQLAAMQMKLKEYQSIGTVEECRTAVERMKPRKPIEYEDKYYGCPKCGNPLMHKWEKYPTKPMDKSKGLPCCLNCLQAIDWN